MNECKKCGCFMISLLSEVETEIDKIKILHTSYDVCTDCLKGFLTYCHRCDDILRLPDEDLEE